MDGKEFVIYGPHYAEGSGLRSVGAAYNPASNAWRRLPLTPDPPEMREGNQVAVWTGEEMLTWGQVDVAYNPKTNTWRMLPAGWSAPSVAVWTGRQALLWGGGCCGEVLRNGVAIDPVTGARVSIPNGPFDGPDSGGVWTGREMIAARTRPPGRGVDREADDRLGWRGARWCPDRWSGRPAVTVSGGASGAGFGHCITHLHYRARMRRPGMVSAPPPGRPKTMAKLRVAVVRVGAR